jgi:hypothetical protein
MGLLMQIGVPMSLGMEGSASLRSFATFTSMWLVMMVAMMLPSTYPTLLLHRTVYRKRTPGRPGGTLMFAASYFLLWTAAGTFFYAAYVWIGPPALDGPRNGIHGASCGRSGARSVGTVPVEPAETRPASSIARILCTLSANIGMTADSARPEWGRLTEFTAADAAGG